MLIDGNAYIGHWPFRKFRYNTLEGLLGRMIEFGTDVSVVSSLNGVFYKNTQSANEELYESLRSKRSYGDRFVPFAVINPIYNGWRDDFAVSTGRFGMKGIRLYPKYHGYELDNPFCVELVKMARDKGLPVSFSLRMVDSRPSSWLDIEDEWSLKEVIPIMRSVPDAKYLVVNVANGTLLGDEDAALFRKTEVVMDTSGRNIVNPGELLRTYGKEKLCFGTHCPILDYFTGLLRIESLREDEADAATKELIRSGNLKRILGI